MSGHSDRKDPRLIRLNIIKAERGLLGPVLVESYKFQIRRAFSKCAQKLIEIGDEIDKELKNVSPQVSLDMGRQIATLDLLASAQATFEQGILISAAPVPATVNAPAAPPPSSTLSSSSPPGSSSTEISVTVLPDYPKDEFRQKFLAK